MALTSALAQDSGGPWADGRALAAVYANRVDRRLTLPPEEQAAYAARLEEAFVTAARPLTTAQYVLLVDRNPNVQALFVYWRAADGTWHWIGGSPVSTGRRGGFEHFITPTGVFDHRIAAALDFRAEGTHNELGVRGYGEARMRVFDFGWVDAQRGWGRGGTSPMRLQLHATDPDLLEPRLGTVASKGCVRVPASLNRLIDQYGLLDADYEDALARGARFWVLHPARTPTPWSGRYLVVVDSGRTARPAWSPPPMALRQFGAAGADWFC
jgi:hypothetical protein